MSSSSSSSVAADPPVIESLSTQDFRRWAKAVQEHESPSIEGKSLFDNAEESQAIFKSILRFVKPKTIVASMGKPKFQRYHNPVYNVILDIIFAAMRLCQFRSLQTPDPIGVVPIHILLIIRCALRTLKRILSSHASDPTFNWESLNDHNLRILAVCLLYNAYVNLGYDDSVDCEFYTLREFRRLFYQESIAQVLTGMNLTQENICPEGNPVEPIYGILCRKFKFQKNIGNVYFYRLSNPDLMPNLDWAEVENFYIRTTPELYQMCEEEIKESQDKLTEEERKLGIVPGVITELKPDVHVKPPAEFLNIQSSTRVKTARKIFSRLDDYIAPRIFLTLLEQCGLTEENGYESHLDAFEGSYLQRMQYAYGQRDQIVQDAHSLFYGLPDWAAFLAGGAHRIFRMYVGAVDHSVKENVGIPKSELDSLGVASMIVAAIGMQEKIEDLMNTGKIVNIQDLFDDIPPGLDPIQCLMNMDYYALKQPIPGITKRTTTRIGDSTMTTLQPILGHGLSTFENVDPTLIDLILPQIRSQSVKMEPYFVYKVAELDKQIERNRQVQAQLQMYAAQHQQRQLLQQQMQQQSAQDPRAPKDPRDPRAARRRRMHSPSYPHPPPP